MSKQDELEITVTLTFNDDSIRTICNAIQTSEEEGEELYNRLKDDPDLFARFSQEIKDTPFMEEIMDGTSEACANDWLCDFTLDMLEEEG